MAFPIIPLIAAAGSAITGIAKGVSAGNKRRKMESYLNKQEAENKAWYNANALSDYTQRADVQNLMKQLRENLKKQNKAAANSAVVTGATVEQQAARKELSNKVISDTFSNLGAMGQRWKDNITNQYLARKRNIADQRMGMWGQKAAADEELSGSAWNQFGNIAGSVAGNYLSNGAFGASGTLPSQTVWSPLGNTTLPSQTQWSPLG